ncbi:MAG: hypothetical protein H0T07_03780 [Actinobacteria bacterium]|nr:hypothetical protein [Actinomycetota bacterium]
MRGRVDFVTALVPHVPTEELHFLPRDVLALRASSCARGWTTRATVLLRAAEVAAGWLRPGGVVLLELGGDQADEVTTALMRAGLAAINVHRDGDGQDRAIEARRPSRTGSR